MIKIYDKTKIFARTLFIPIEGVSPIPTTIIWIGLGSNNNWSTSSNWNIRVPQAYDILQFAGTTRLTPFNNLTIDTPYNGIAFNAGAGAFTLSGNRFVLNSGSITNNSSNTQTINNDIVLGTTAGTINCATSALILRGNISGSGSLTKLGTSTLSLSGNNSYTGNTVINSGTINVLNSNPFGTGIVNCPNNGTSSNGFINIPSTATPANTIINNPIIINGSTSQSLFNIVANKSATLNGLLACGPDSREQFLNIANNATLTINGGISGISGWNNSFGLLGVGTYVISSPVIFNASSLLTQNSNTVTLILSSIDNKFNILRIIAGTVRTDVSFAINDEIVRIGSDLIIFGNKLPLLNLNGTDQIIRNIQNNSSNFVSCTSTNIFNNSSTFSNLTANNTSNTTYTGSISGNINLIKTGTSTLTLSGSTALGVGPRYTGFTAISAGTLFNYALSSNPSNKVNFAQFTNTALTVNFTTPPIVGDSFILLSGRTVNLYPSVTLQNASGRTASYNSTTSTLSVIT
jgi:autotransporter-associated beta strand protein